MPSAAQPPVNANKTDRRWQDLQQSRAELDASRSETMELRKGLRSMENGLRTVEHALASYFNKTKNPFKLTISRMLAPSAMRRERKAIEADLKLISHQLKTLRGASSHPVAQTAVPGESVAPRFANSSVTARRHVIISGTGRGGTTFLMELLTSLGLQTGYQHYSTLINPIAHAGLEWDIRKEDAPYIVKNPGLCDYLPQVLEDGRVVIDHAFVPMRDLRAAARSRATVSSEATSPHAAGGLWDAIDQKDQETVLRQKLCNLFVTLAEHNISTTLLAFPRLVDDGEYLYEKLTPILDGIRLDNFLTIFGQVSRPGLVTRG